MFVRVCIVVIGKMGVESYGPQSNDSVKMSRSLTRCTKWGMFLFVWEGEGREIAHNLSIETTEHILRAFFVGTVEGLAI